MGGRYSRDKGKRGEREAIELLQPVVDEVYERLRKEGLDVGDTPMLQRNTLQSDKGGFDLANLPGFAIEVKNCATLQLDSWWREAVSQAKAGQRPVLLYKLARRGWRARVVVDAACGGIVNIVADVAFDDFRMWFRECLYYTTGVAAWQAAKQRAA